MLEQNHTSNGVVNLGDTFPEKKKYQLNGRIIEGWVVTNRRYPPRIAAALDDARTRYYNALSKAAGDESQRPLADLLDGVRLMLSMFDSVAGVDAATVTDAVSVIRSSMENYDSNIGTNKVAWADYQTDCLLALMPGLTLEEAELLGDHRLEILFDLGQLRRPDAANQQEAAEAQNPPDQASPSPGAKRERGSRASTT